MMVHTIWRYLREWHASGVSRILTAVANNDRNNGLTFGACLFPRSRAWMISLLMLKKIFARGKKQEFEAVLLYCWLRGVINDDEYWESYMEEVL
jgi:hypothetical protein